MLAAMKKRLAGEESGFTLIELLVVIIIIGILAAIAIPVFLNQRKKGYDAQAKSDLRNLATLEETYLTDNQVYAGNVSLLTDFKPSANATTTVVSVRNVADSFCLKSVSKSGTDWYYDSNTGGLMAKGATCT